MIKSDIEYIYNYYSLPYKYIRKDFNLCLKHKSLGIDIRNYKFITGILTLLNYEKIKHNNKRY